MRFLLIQLWTLDMTLTCNSFFLSTAALTYHILYYVRLYAFTMDYLDTLSPPPFFQFPFSKAPAGCRSFTLTFSGLAQQGLVRPRTIYASSSL